MAVKVVKANLKMKLKGGQANAAPPVGSTLGQYGVNMMDFITPFNEQTKDQMGKNVTVHIAIYEDRSMSFRVVSAPTDDLIRDKLGIKKGSGKPNSEKIAKKLSDTTLTEIAEAKAADMNTDDIPAVKKMVAGTARSMGVEVEGWETETLSPSNGWSLKASMTRIESGETWYLGHATPDELVKFVAKAEIDAAWTDHGGNVLDDNVALAEAKSAYLKFANGVTESVRDRSVEQAIKSVKPNGMNPVAERYVETYLSKF